MGNPFQDDITVLDDWFQGEDVLIEWTIYSDEEMETVQDITDFTIQFRMAIGRGGLSVLTKTLSLVTPTSGLCRATIDAADTVSLAGRKYNYNLRRTDSGFNSMLCHGDAHLLAAVQ